MALAFVGILIIGTGGSDGKQSTSKNLREPEKPALVIPEINTNTQYTQEYDNTDDKEYQDELAEEDLDREVEDALDEMDEAEEEEIEINDSMLVSAVKSVEDNLKFYLGKIFGSDEEDGEDEQDDDEEETSADVKIGAEELDAIANEISEKIEDEVKTEFRERADEIAEEKVDEIDQIITEDRQAGLQAEEVRQHIYWVSVHLAMASNILSSKIVAIFFIWQIAVDVIDAEKVVEADLKDEIDEAAKKVKDELPDKIKQIRNEVIKEHTGKNLVRYVIIFLSFNKMLQKKN